MLSENDCHPLHDFVGESRWRVTKEVALRLLESGCVMCQKPFVKDSTRFDIEYERSELYSIGLTPLQVAECQLSVIHNPLWSNAETIYIIDQKAAVCQKCWVEFLRQVVALKGS